MAPSKKDRNTLSLNPVTKRNRDYRNSLKGAGKAKHDAGNRYRVAKSRKLSKLRRSQAYEAADNDEQKRMEEELIASLEEEREATHDSDSVDDFIVEDNPSDLDGNDPDADFEPENNSGNEQDDGASEDDGASKDNDEPANDVVDDPNGNIEAIPQAVQDQIKEKRASEKQKQKLKNWCMEISRWKIAYRFYREKRNELEKDGEGYLSMLGMGYPVEPHNLFNMRERAWFACDYYSEDGQCKFPGPIEFWHNGDPSYLKEYGFSHSWGAEHAHEGRRIILESIQMCTRAWENDQSAQIHPEAHKLIPSEKVILAYHPSVKEAIPQEYREDFMREYEQKSAE